LCLMWTERACSTGLQRPGARRSSIDLNSCAVLPGPPRRLMSGSKSRFRVLLCRDRHRVRADVASNCAGGLGRLCSIAVVDGHGNLKAFARLGSALLFSIRIAPYKTYAALRI
jgi:hypothetical protein